jgi:hypothetical protein
MRLDPRRQRLTQSGRSWKPLPGGPFASVTIHAPTAAELVQDRRINRSAA